MRSADSGKLAETAQDLVRWILDQALDGIGPLPSASDLAEEYKCQPYANDTERVQALIRWTVAKNAGTGFVAGLGGVLTLPVTIPGSLAASLAIQAPMVAAIAEIYGHNSKDDQVRTAILLCMIGTAMEDVAKQAGVTLGGKIAVEALRKVPGNVLIEINKRIGFRLLTKFGERGVVNLAKLVPLLGGAFGGTFDGATCYVVGQAADRVFRPTATDHGLAARIETAVAALEAQIDTRTTQLEARLVRWMIGTVIAGIVGAATVTATWGRGAPAVARGPRQWVVRWGESAPPTSLSARARAG